MTEFGLLSTGPNIKRLADIKASLEERFRDQFGAGIKLGPDTTFGKLIAVVADELSAAWEYGEEVYDSQYPGSASDVSLDRVVAITGISRNPALRSTVTIYCAGTPTTVIPAGSLIAVEDANDQFRTTADITLGAVGNFSITSITRSGSTATVEATGHGLSVGEWVFIAGANETEYNGLFQVATVADADHFTYTVSGTPSTPATGTIEGDGATAGAAESVNTGPVVALSGTLNVIVNAVSGWDRVENALDATLGVDEETDAALRTRQKNALAGLGAAHLEAITGALLAVTNVTQAIVFENDTGLIDGAGRPAHTIECLVIGGTDADIRSAIFANKAGGIETYGTESGTVTDSEGEDHTIKFSRATAVDIYLEVDLTVDADFPGGGAGEAQVEALILAWAETLEIGEDVIVYPALIASFASVPGITDVAIRIDTAGSPSTDDNIVIAETELADFDASRITVDVP